MDISHDELMSARSYRDIFKNVLTYKELFKTLSKKFHPDIMAGGNDNYFKYLNTLYSEAKKADEEGTFGKSLFHIDNYVFDADKYFYEDGSDIYFCDSNKFQYVKLFSVENKNLFDRELSVLSVMRKAIETVPVEKQYFNLEGFIPDIEKSMALPDGRTCLIYNTSLGNYLPLSEILKKYSNLLTIEHLGWIISRLLENLSILDMANLIHSNITEENVWIQPKTHRLMLGSLYSCYKFGKIDKTRYYDKNNPELFEKSSDRYCHYQSVANVIKKLPILSKYRYLVVPVINRLQVKNGLRTNPLNILRDSKQSFKEEFGDKFYKLEIP